jgi:D-sedoheptulose 7-phosphate isomerase
VIPTLDPAQVTPHAESFQAVIWHCLVCHPSVMTCENKWEGLAPPANAA